MIDYINLIDLIFIFLSSIGIWISFFIEFSEYVLTDGPAVVNINLFVRSITTISDIKMVSNDRKNNVPFYVSVVSVKRPDYKEVVAFVF